MPASERCRCGGCGDPYGGHVVACGHGSSTGDGLCARCDFYRMQRKAPSPSSEEVTEEELYEIIKPARDEGVRALIKTLLAAFFMKRREP